MEKHNVLYAYNGQLFSLKKKKILTPASTWMNLEDIMINEKASHERPNTG